MMDQIKYLSFLLFIAVLEFSCSHKDEQDFQEINIEVPVAFEGNTAVKAYVNSSCKYVNDWSEKLGDQYNKCQEFSTKKESELSPEERNRLGKIMMDYMAGIGQFTVGMAEIENNGVTLQAEFSNEGQQAMDTILNIFRNRAIEINRQYESLNSETD